MRLGRRLEFTTPADPEMRTRSCCGVTYGVKLVPDAAPQ
jgi:hypothetical protein